MQSDVLKIVAEESKMKVHILSLVFVWCILQVLSVRYPEELIEDYIRECLEELKLENEVLDVYFDDIFRVVNLDDRGDKLVGCLVKRCNYYRSDGKYNKEVMIKDIVKWMKFLVKREVENYEALAEKLHGNCGNMNGKDRVEKLINWNNCLAEEIELLNK
ncbi:hypothetical protein PPYR_13434 [Photinus pyralis]|uniref:Uncharacterized protein n=1 Tax=Photinus pyralis TaxID=7054 RepID=A0A1Y1LIB8_PHOPY|nr:uncharacterized protein LOC116178864 [Photinus pyralis]KAB0793814.1 hypothetical protein PPYR_13434 [Photinus pyralis]